MSTTSKVVLIGLCSLSVVGVAAVVGLLPLEHTNVPVRLRREALVTIRAIAFLCTVISLLRVWALGRAPPRTTKTTKAERRQRVVSLARTAAPLAIIAFLVLTTSPSLAVLGALFVAAATEEIVFRRILPYQIARIAWYRLGGSWADTIGLVVAQTTFALSHVVLSGGLIADNALLTAARLFADGCLLSSLYVVGGLPLSIAVHAVINGTIVTSAPVEHPAASTVVVGMVLAGPIHWWITQWLIRRSNGDASAVPSFVTVAEGAPQYQRH